MHGEGNIKFRTVCLSKLKYMYILVNIDVI
jgi:hypothetical protein